ncbi:MAG: peptidoglycan recognition protein family protein, partial [Anaerolineae bacterium]
PAPMPVKPLPSPSPDQPPPTVQLSPVDPESLVVDLRERLPRRGEARYEKRDLASVDTVVFHWASDVVRDYSPREIAEYQTGPHSYLPFPEIAYHFVITWNGTIYFTQDLSKRTWHAGEWNSRSIGVLACPAQGGLLTDAQVLSARNLLRWLREALGRELALKGHSELRETSCPGPGWERNKARILAAPLPTYPFEYHYVLLGQTPERIVPWSWIEAMRDYIHAFRVTLGFSHDHAMMSSERTPVRHITIIGSPDAEVPVSLEVEEMLRASGALVNRVMGKTAGEIKAELDRRVREGKPYG